MLNLKISHRDFSLLKSREASNLNASKRLIAAPIPGGTRRKRGLVVGGVRSLGGELPLWRVIRGFGEGGGHSNSFEAALSGKGWFTLGRKTV